MIYPWQHNAWNALSRARARDHMPHALLLAGPEHCGKRDFALSLAKALLCENAHGSDDFACGHCKSCYLFEASSHPDYTSVLLEDKKTQIVVDQIRQLNEFVYLSRSYQESRVVFIYPVERLNTNAANSLLKTLEEPPKDTVMLLVSSNFSQLIPTIRSRCQIIQLPQPTTRQASEWLEAQDLTHPVGELLLASGGRPLLAKALDSGDKLAERKQFATDILKLLQGRHSLVSVAKRWEKSDKGELLDWQLQWIESMIRSVFSGDEAVSDAISPHLRKHMSLKNSDLWRLRDSMIELKNHAHTSLNALLYTENMLLLWQKEALNR